MFYYKYSAQWLSCVLYEAAETSAHSNDGILFIQQLPNTIIIIRQAALKDDSSSFML
jgi:hypothetical protein